MAPPSRIHVGVEQLTVEPIKEISGHVKLPGSKSLSNRILLLAALAEGTTLVKNLLVGELHGYILTCMHGFQRMHGLGCQDQR